MAVPAERLANTEFPMPGRGAHAVKVPTNEYGIVVPPHASGCMEDLCIWKGEEETSCEMTVHHLHSTFDTYLYEGRVSHKFRNLPVLTVWTPECRHQIYHEIHEIDVPIPNFDVMKQCIREARALKRLVGAHKELSDVTRELTQDGLSKKRIYGLENRQEELLEDKEEILGRVATIEVIPDELVTGALLICSPENAQRRLFTGTGYVLTGLLEKEQIPEAIDTANEILELVA